MLKIFNSPPGSGYFKGDWVAAMDKTIRDSGRVLLVDRAAKKALLQLYKEERSLRQQWWYPFTLLKKPVKTVSDPFANLRAHTITEVYPLPSNHPFLSPFMLIFSIFSCKAYSGY